ncbi:probable 4-coumarate--CoA ligase 1 [Homarus americanus]|uniref:probable 4-coumarate--CoA ligase 1 n=1 Tax=Homarus americanus TaxID=6706 RepID=UPI001C45F3F0|nr:probable 4-coumarate--CoA ligase 1 [Homarus americanus]XP_042231091.1 probable 4-coumarate--CoA ligase 1 [Homarus americanus]XP_042231092.1 probable 4-coumarate--CoA ligase 1 [Homarus americanus]
MWLLKAARGVRATAAALTTQYTRSFRRDLTTTWAACNIQRSHVPDIDLPSGNLVNTIFKNVSKWGNKTATECTVTGRRYTYSQLMDRIARWGGFLTKLGVHRGDVVGVALGNCPEYPIVFFGAIAIGAVATTINPAYSAEEIARHLRDSEAKVLVGDPLMHQTVTEALKLYKSPTHLVLNGPPTTSGTLNLQQIIEDPTVPFTDPVMLTGEEVAALPYSSGTTGSPKGVSLSHNAITSNTVMVTHPDVFMAQETTEENQESYMGLLPFFHVSGIAVLMSSGFYEGVKLLTVPKFDPKTYISSVVQHKVKTLHLVPSILNFLVNSPETKKETLGQVTKILCGAAPLQSSAVHAFKEKISTDISFVEGWGMTEILLTTLVPKGVDKIGTIGKLLPNVTAKVVDLETGKALPANRDGEICVKTPSIMRGYHNNPAATQETIDSEGWLHSGDVGRYDDEGFFKIVDRTKELIKVNELQVSPSELEEIICQHPGVVDVGVVGVPDESMGEAPRAFIVTEGTIHQEDIHSFLKPRVARHKQLAGGIFFVEALPKNATGKLLRQELKKMGGS